MTRRNKATTALVTTTAVVLGAVFLTACTAQDAADTAACAGVVQKAVAGEPAGSSDAQLAFAAGMAASVTPACVGLSSDVVSAFSKVPAAVAAAPATP